MLEKLEVVLDAAFVTIIIVLSVAIFAAIAMA